MTLRVPLEVRLKTSRTDRVVTADLRDLTFMSVDPGGYASAQLSFDRPLLLRPDELDYFAGLYVYDGRRGAVVWEGWVEDLGGSVNDQGQIWRLAGVGPSSHTKDLTRPYIVVDSSLDKYSPTSANQLNVSWNSGRQDEATGAPAIAAQLSNGSWTLAGTVAEASYRLIYDAGQELARVSVGWDSGMASTVAWQVSIWTWDSPGGTGSFRATDFVDNVGGTMIATLAGDGGTIGAADMVIGFNVGWNGPTNYVNPASGDQLWWSWDSAAVRAKLYTKAGGKRTSGYSADTVTADEVVADLLGRPLLPLYDGTNATVTAGSFAIAQLAYPDGASPDKVLSDLMGLEPGFTWHAWESNTAGKYRFEWVAYPTTVTYDADALDGYSPENTAEDMFNSVRVRYNDPTGGIRTVVRTSTVTALANAGRTREAFLDVGDEAAMSAPQANKVGDNWLADHGVPSNAGRLTIARQVLDNSSGRMVDPWEIKPGQLIRVAGVQPRLDALNPTGRDGQTVFRVKSMEYDATNAAATLELDAYTRETAQALAALQAVSPKQQRRR